ncbi:MAG: hypothetical protein H6R07_2163 [Proteobacteria bacterium]|nr:hypothetical protein [Pseudomonadota bacterium]
MKRMILPLFLLMAMALYLTVREESQNGVLRIDNSKWMGNEPRYRAGSLGEASEPPPGAGREVE